MGCGVAESSERTLRNGALPYDADAREHLFVADVADLGCVPEVDDDDLSNANTIMCIWPTDSLRVATHYAEYPRPTDSIATYWPEYPRPNDSIATGWPVAHNSK